jgi:hypothetical protein
MLTGNLAAGEEVFSRQFKLLRNATDNLVAGQVEFFIQFGSRSGVIP